MTAINIVVNKKDEKTQFEYQLQAILAMVIVIASSSHLNLIVFYCL